MISVSTELSFSFSSRKLMLVPLDSCIGINGFAKEDMAGLLEAKRGLGLTASISPFTVGDFSIKASNTSSVSFLTYKSTEREGESCVTKGAQGLLPFVQVPQADIVCLAFGP